MALTETLKIDTNNDEIVLVPVDEPGSHWEGSVTISYLRIVKTLGEPNVTTDDPDKVTASWHFIEPHTNQHLALWCYRANDPTTCTQWSFYGDMDLFNRVFPDGMELRNELARKAHQLFETGEVLTHTDLLTHVHTDIAQIASMCMINETTVFANLVDDLVEIE